MSETKRLNYPRVAAAALSVAFFGSMLNDLTTLDNPDLFATHASVPEPVRVASLTPATVVVTPSVAPLSAAWRRHVIGDLLEQDFVLDAMFTPSDDLRVSVMPIDHNEGMAELICTLIAGPGMMPGQRVQIQIGDAITMHRADQAIMSRFSCAGVGQ